MVYGSRFVLFKCLRDAKDFLFEKYVHIRISNKRNQHQTTNIIHIQRMKQNDTNIQSFAINIVKMIKIKYACETNTNTHTCRFINNKQTVAMAL